MTMHYLKAAAGVALALSLSACVSMGPRNAPAASAVV